MEEDVVVHARHRRARRDLHIVGQPRRLRLFYVLDRVGEVCVWDLGEILGVTQSAISQHLAKFKAYGLSRHAVTARPSTTASPRPPP